MINVGKRSIKNIRFEYRITSIYFVIGSLWIYLSDTFFGSLIKDKQFLTVLSIYKGSFYVLLTSFLLFYLVKKQMQRISVSETEARDNDIKFRAITNQAAEGIILSDIEGNLKFVNPSFCKMTGYSEDELLTKTIFDLKWKTQLLSSSFGNKTTNEGGPIEDILQRKDGTEIITEIMGKAIIIHDQEFVLGTVRDITERKHSEHLIAQEKERLSVTLRSIGDGVITTDTDGRIVMLNKAAEEMTGWEAADAAGRSLQEVFVIINELTREPYENPVDQVLSTGNIVELTNHTCLIVKNGSEIKIADSAAPIRDNENQIAGVVLVFRDMTEEQKLTDSMQRTQKLESLGILAGGIAHDFNNMLAGIFGYLDLAKASAAHNKAEQVQTYLDKALHVFDRAKGLTQQLLTFSKGGTPIRLPIHLAPLIQHSVNFALSGSNVTCQFDLAEDLSICDCDENQIGQVIDNIVINAKQAMPSGGNIVVSAVNVTDLPGHPGNFVHISIQDQGIGIPQEIIPKIFDPFFSTKTTGHGLGLATVFSIIQRHDGWIDVESTSGRGTKFNLFIPASQKKTTVRREKEAMTHEGIGTILVMDDEKFLREIVSEMLQGMGYITVLAGDGKEAVALFADAEKSGHPFVASILDLTIPGGAGGKDVAAALRNLNPNAVIIASSGYSEDPIISNPTDHGFTDRIIKPYRRNDLLELMSRVMRR
jgi:two-component system, cell cycle sensor histidine kinase and response regulator CckA